MEKCNIELFEVNNVVRVVFNVQLSELTGRKYIELESPSYQFEPTNDQWRIKFLCVCDDVNSSNSLEKFNYYYYCNQKLIPSISLHIDSCNRIGGNQVYVYQVIVSLYSCPEFGVIGFQSRHVSQSYIKHPRMFSLNQLQHAGKDTGLVRICFEVSCYEERQQINVPGPSSNCSPVQTIHHNVSLLNLFSFLERGVHSDVTLRAIDGKEFKAHKLILSARSPVFATMFQNNMQETHTGLVNVDFSADVVEEMLRFIYTNKTKNFNVFSLELFAAAHMYELETLQKMCKDQVCANINVENVTEVLRFAERYSLNDVADSALDFVSIREADVVRKKDFIAYLVERLRADNVASYLEMAHRYRLTDFHESLVKFIAKNFTAVMKDREYRELYRTNSNLILDIDDRLSRYVAPLD